MFGGARVGEQSMLPPSDPLSPKDLDTLDTFEDSNDMFRQWADSGAAATTTQPTRAQCARCCEPVRTLYMPCLSCGHGFHISCFRLWFTSPNQKCPAIGCDCL